MKYRIKSIVFRNQRTERGSFRAQRKKITSVCILPPATTKTSENINFNTLFELGQLPAPKRPPIGRRILKRFKSFLSVFARILSGIGLALLKIIKYPFRHSRDKNRRIAFCLGLFCSAVLVALLSLVTVLIGLFGRYLAPYDELTVPYVVGEELSDVESVADENYELIISYKSSDDIPAGVVISQTPDGGVTRKLYKNGKPCTLTLTVSTGKSFYTVESLVGTESRTSILELRNKGIAIDTVYEYSSDIPSGVIISTSPTEGQRVYDDDVLTVRISLGKKINTSTVPDLYGLNEAAARSLLESRGLALGSITYKQSTVGAGKVISQEYSPYTVLDEGTAVNITVSLGNSVTEKRVPDLYGLTVAEATQKLAEVGLVVGSVYSVSSGAPSGIVITQTPIAGTPITSSINYVDLYISS